VTTVRFVFRNPRNTLTFHRKTGSLECVRVPGENGVPGPRTDEPGAFADPYLLEESSLPGAY